ncbi:MAG: helix-turn-helix transcriptional regulator [Bdellovibrionota bacterium]
MTNKNTDIIMHITSGDVFDDLGFTPEEVAVIKLKFELLSEILKIIEKKKLSARNLEKILNVPQPRVSELLNGKISKMSSDKLTKYLALLDRSVKITTRYKKYKKPKAA